MKRITWSALTGSDPQDFVGENDRDVVSAGDAAFSRGASHGNDESTTGVVVAVHPLMIFRAALMTAVLMGACIDNDGDGFLPDASVDDDLNSGSGSGAALSGEDPSPPDVTLQWIVLGLSVVVVGGSARSRRRATKTFEL